MKAIEEFLEKEKEYKMYDKKVLGIYYWEYVRGFISNEANTIISKSSPMFASTKLNFKKLFFKE